MSKFPPLNEQMDIIRSGVEEIIPEAELVKKIEKSIANNEPLKIKCGCDPSRPDLHIGHAVLLRKMRQFQDLGHQAILLIGDFTAMIGDPTGRNKTRPQLTIEDTKLNAQSYIDQASIVLDKSTLEIVYNSDWLSKMDFSDVIKLASKYTVARMLERDDFTKRYGGGVRISLHEFLYPLAQGYDSVYLNADVELGGTDQKFNLLVGRDLQKESGQTPQVVITTMLLEGTDGVEKMSKSYDNYIGLTDSPTDMYGRTLSIPDALIGKYFEYATTVSIHLLDDIKDDLKEGKSNPRDLKRQLAREIVKLYHDEDAAQKAESDFDALFIKKDIPDDIPEYALSSAETLVSIMVGNNLVSSNGDAKRMIKQGAVKLDDEKVSDLFFEVSPDSEKVLKVGKRKFLRITI
ncbi:MAG: tyrosine--tRNA ligase [Candidatus Marinimicrobia bacterium]|nr:tyrosine--tRNA ligase [Candidatus Neomarinimicrobiota bacterium]MBT7377783.1 tyrosine--tRNA ligase [Candidatus Neomarinimicrobiota bacterium]|tara:strand:- start:9937 stop:11148 length:1212 start_codon:yes stop_codon:yes gene_type:complete